MAKARGMTIMASHGLGAIALIFGLSTSACSAPVSITSQEIPLFRDDPTLQQVDQLDYLGGLVLQGPSAFGGLSDLLVDANGRMTAISDQDHWFSAQLVFDPQLGRLTGISDGQIEPILDQHGRPVVGKHFGDAESLALEQDDLLVGFENRHRIWRFPGPGALGQRRPLNVEIPSGIRTAPSNGGLEAMVRLHDGRLLIFSEQATDFSGQRKGWLIAGDGNNQDDQRFGPVYLTPERDFQPVGLCILPSGDVLLLERAFRPITGLRARLSKLSYASLQPEATLERQEIARLEGDLNIDNFEGIAAQPLADGSVRILLLSDDNFSILQRTLLLAFRYQPD